MQTSIKILLITFSLVLFSFYAVNATPNPAAVYCIDLGYDYKIVNTKLGGMGICILPTEECEEWEFFTGECGQQYSYCAINGYDIEIKTDGKNPYSPHYAVCVNKATKKEIGSVSDLMNFKERLRISTHGSTKTLTPPCHNSDGLDFYTKDEVRFDGTIYPDKCVNEEVLIEGYCENGYFKTTTYYCPEGCSEGACIGNVGVKKLEVSATSSSSEFDWRDVDGIDWMTSVQDQGDCGSCWAFSAIGALEAKINIVNNNPDYDVDLSEEELIPCTDFGDCTGGYLASGALNYLKNTGVVTESCFPYVSGTCGPIGSVCDTSKCLYENPCSNSLCDYPYKCPDPNPETWKIEDYPEVPSDSEDIKNALKDPQKGPLAATIQMDEAYFYNGILRCVEISGSHDIVIVGYNDIDEYWIAKNSWGVGWDESPAEPSPIDGYFFIGYGQCNINPRYWIEMIPDYCEESDNGDDPLTGGTVSGYHRGFSFSHTDECLDGINLKEYYCSGGQWHEIPFDCAYEYGSDYICFDDGSGGRCKYQNVPPESCNDYDHGIQPLTIASVYGYDYYGEYYRHHDTCTDDDDNEVTTSDRYLKERYCEGTTPRDTIIDCKLEYGDNYYCSYGKCYSGRSGCPILKVWNGEEFVAIEKLDIHAPEGIDTTLLKEVSMQPIEDGKYKIILKEAPYLSLGDDGSNIDSLMLTTEDGEDCELISAVHNKKGDVLSAIAESDDVRVRTEPDEEIVLIYECSGNDFVLSVEGYNPLRPPRKLTLTWVNSLIQVFKGLVGINY